MDDAHDGILPVATAWPGPTTTPAAIALSLSFAFPGLTEFALVGEALIPVSLVVFALIGAALSG
jgi:hypothetical protein